jgi:hypothetical protein
MKKVYMQPAAEIVETDAIELLTSSLGVYDDETIDGTEILAPEMDEDIFGE